MNLTDIMSQAKFYSDYSRFDTEENRYETWNESVSRVMGMHREKYANELNGNDELEEVFQRIERNYLDKTFLGAQRALQFGGDQLMKNNARMYNCVSTYADRTNFFGEFMWFLLSGSGVGVSVQNRHTENLPDTVKPKGGIKEFIIEDSIEGWADAFQVLISSYLEPSGAKFDEWSGKRIHLNYENVRPKGAPISGGFKAPGPEPLRKALIKAESLLLQAIETRGAGSKLENIEIYDICMFAADAVVSGGVRRSATIFLFSVEDDAMMNAKIGNYFTDNPQRSRSNNSVVLKRGDFSEEELKEIIHKVKNFGEPGFVFVDDYDTNYNPCVEIGMYSYLDEEKKVSGLQGCNLTEINGEKAKTKEDFYEACWAASAMGTLQAGYTKFPYVELNGSTTREIFEREALIGVSITGISNNPGILLDAHVLKAGSSIVKATNKTVAALIGINQAARTTCVKPSGNASVLLGTSSGIHPHKGKKMLRYNTYMDDSPIAAAIKESNPYMVEHGAGQANSYAIAFPIEVPEGALTVKDMSAFDFLDNVKTVYENWVLPGTNLDLCVNKEIRHNVSNTVDLEEGDWEHLPEYLFNNNESFSAVSLMSSFGDRAFYQAPFTVVKDADEIASEYGAASMFASGLIVDAVQGFSNLWEACYISENTEGELEGEKGDLQMRWVRRFRKFAGTFFAGDLSKTTMCLKDVQVLYKYSKIVENYAEVDYGRYMGSEEKLVDVDTLAAQACAGGVCEIEF